MKSDFSPATPSFSSRITVGIPYFCSEVFAVGSILRHVDVAADAGILGDADAFLQRLIRQREGGVQAHHGRDLPIALADLLDEALVLLDPAARHVAVRDLIAQRGADPGLADGRSRSDRASRRASPGEA